MADEIEFSIDTARWGAAVEVYANRFNIGTREALYEEWPLLMQKIIEFTPPKSLAQGRAATANDIKKTMQPFDPSAIRSKSLEKIVRTKDFAAFNIMAQRAKGLMKGKHAMPFSPEIHTRQRNKRGRVGLTAPQSMLGSDAGLLKKYVKQVQDRVGWAKAGWLRALALVGGFDRAPGFVTRHGMSGGDVIDDHANETDPSITAINRTPWAARADEGQRIVRDARDSRYNAILSKIRTKLRLAATAAGFDNAA